MYCPVCNRYFRSLLGDEHGTRVCKPCSHKKQNLMADLREEAIEQERGNECNTGYTADLLRRAIIEIERLREALEHYASCSDGCICDDGWDHTVAIDALSKAAQAAEGSGDDDRNSKSAE